MFGKDGVQKYAGTFKSKSRYCDTADKKDRQPGCTMGVSSLFQNHVWYSSQRSVKTVLAFNVYVGHTLQEWYETQFTVAFMYPQLCFFFSHSEVRFDDQSTNRVQQLRVLISLWTKNQQKTATHKKAQDFTRRIPKETFIQNILLKNTNESQSTHTRYQTSVFVEQLWRQFECFRRVPQDPPPLLQWEWNLELFNLSCNAWLLGVPQLQ